MRPPIRTAAATPPPRFASGLLVRAVLWGIAVRAVFLLLFGLMAFVAFVYLHSRGVFVSIYLSLGTLLLPVLVPVLVFLRTREPAREGPRTPPGIALLAAGLALLVTVVPVPGTPPTALVYALPSLERGLSGVGFIAARLASGPLHGVRRLADGCQRPDDCLGAWPSYQCATAGFRNVCVATTKPGPAGCPQGWSCVVTRHNEDPAGDTEDSDCVPAPTASRFKASSDCQGRVKVGSSFEDQNEAR